MDNDPHPTNHHSSNLGPCGLEKNVPTRMIPTSMCLVPQRPPGYHWSCEFHGEMSEELELESTRFSELDTQREQLEALIQGGNRIHRIRDG